ncbi:KLTH0D06974p [Lachancea thermotolerans CBS 6340]|uniref:KLTH0D06974p n=1 Tax=Lachancea thermotolerans (strain ATCC 56472 / CBS 6340 / NRRL Y-8284) TaxID=559295 RepID=C5DGP4_LACTC|nr:KLTH0D06974p [Lachancea thermotolerans CBS 6340]CAR22586.1 KLTH0D06974p [Lachancea thermotolerans CBS 6340]
MCSNEECRAILPKKERELLLKAAKVEKTRDDGTTVVGFPRVKCDGMMLIDDSREDLYNQHRKPGFCNSCKATHSMSWYNDNVYKGKRICHNCNTYQCYTQARCQNEACSLIHHSKHLTEIKLNYRRETGKNAGIEAVLKCIKCQGPVAIDKTKTIRDRKVPYKPGACLTCDRRSERKWKRIPWDKVSSQRMCGKCEARYRKTATRCLNTGCSHIHTIGEVAKMENMGKIKAHLPDGTIVLGHPCVKCGCTTYKDTSMKLSCRKKAEAGQMCYSCKSQIKGVAELVAWDKQNPERLCRACFWRYHTYKAHCDSAECSLVPNKEGLDALKKKGPIEVCEETPVKKVYHAPCPKCKG